MARSDDWHGGLLRARVGLFASLVLVKNTKRVAALHRYPLG